MFDNLKPHVPGQVWKVSLDYIKGDYWYLYISDMVMKHHIDNKLSLCFRICKLPYNPKSGYLYYVEDVCNMETSVLENKLKGAEYVRTIKPRLSYEQFVDIMVNSTARIAIIAGGAAAISGLTLALIHALM